jgi:hypothetical protein
VGCEFGESEGEIVESVCQLEHLEKRHVVVTQLHVVARDGVDEVAPMKVKVVEVVTVEEQKLAHDVAESAAVVNACVIKQAEAAEDLLDSVKTCENENARTVSDVEGQRRGAEI